MPMFRAIKKGYYGDVIHDPDTDHHVVFPAHEGFKASWAVPADEAEVAATQSEEPPAAKEGEGVPVPSTETLEAEALLDAEANASAEVLSQEDDDVNEATGVEVL